jgi:hypothetical protein
MSDRSVNSSKARRRLAPSEKYEIFVAVLTGQATQREAAANAGVDGDLPDGEAGGAGRAGRQCAGSSRPVGRGGGAGPGGGGDRPAAGGHRRAGGGVASARGKSVLGLSAGPVPPRVDGDVKVGLLELVDHAGDCGWPVRRACALLGLDHARYHHWAAAALPAAWTTCGREATRATASWTGSGRRSSSCSRPGARSTGRIASAPTAAPG